MLFRGTSLNKKEAPFRDCFSRLHKLRTLAPNVKLIASTTTATETTRCCISCPENEVSIPLYESPNKRNMTYNVTYMPNDVDFNVINVHMLHILKTFSGKFK